jgi:hypothetical protein
MEIIRRLRHVHRSFSFLLLALCTSLLIDVQSARATEPAAKVEEIEGKAEAVSASGGPARVLEVDSTLFEGDSIRTGDSSRVLLVFADQTRFHLAANAEMVVEKFAHRGDKEDGFFESRIVKGTFRFITGLVAKRKPSSMQVRTAVATIGIRGTHVVGEASATAATIILMEPEGESRPTAIEVANSFGSVTIDQPGYGTEVPDEHSPPSPPRRMKLQTIQNLMRSMQSIQRVNVPRPQMHMH